MIVTGPEDKSPEVEDHPLNPNPTSQWQSFFKDNEVLLQIDKDVRRLCPDLTFFQQVHLFLNQYFLVKCLAPGHGSSQPCDNERRQQREAAHPGHAGAAGVPGGQQEGGGPEHTVQQQEEGGGGLQPHHGGRSGGPLGGRAEDPLPLRQAQPGPGLRAGDE